VYREVVSLGARYAGEDEGAEVGDGRWDSRGWLGLMSARRGQSWSPCKGSVHRLAWPRRKTRCTVV
jgi:hypothetical protein